MDQTRFDTWTRELAQTSPLVSRRWAMARVAGAALTGLAVFAGIDRTTEAAGCKRVDEPCKRAGQCCSGICNGKRGKKKCRGHGAGTCKRNQDVCATSFPEGERCNNEANCLCLQTTSGTSFCANPGSNGVACTNCKRDADCRQLGFPEGSACVVVSTGWCSGTCASGRGCMVRCGVEPQPVD
jgi:hypothetical protein